MTVKSICGCEGANPRRAGLSHKLMWMRLNRLLAWTVLVSPAVQIALGTPFMKGLWIDLGLLAGHGVLSLALFGAPRVPAGGRWMLWFGIGPLGLSPRNKFLLSGWRIALGLGFLATLPILPWPWQLLLTLGPIYLLLLLAIPGHVFGAADYAFRRWGADSIDSSTWALCVVAFVAIANTINLLR